MSTQLNTKGKLELLDVPTADQKPLFAPDFIRIMTDAAYETLRAYLEQAKARPEAISLLDDLVLSLCWKKMDASHPVNWIENQGMAEALGAMSYDIMALGGGAILKK